MNNSCRKTLYLFDFSYVTMLRCCLVCLTNALPESVTLTLNFDFLPALNKKNATTFFFIEQGCEQCFVCFCPTLMAYDCLFSVELLATDDTTELLSADDRTD